MKRFYLTGDNGKEAFVAEVDGLRLMVDIDDVDQVKTAANLRKALVILNFHWDLQRWEYASYIPDACQLATTEETDEESDVRWKRRDAKYREIMKYLSDPEATP